MSVHKADEGSDPGVHERGQQVNENIRLPA